MLGLSFVPRIKLVVSKQSNSLNLLQKKVVNLLIYRASLQPYPELVGYPLPMLVCLEGYTVFMLFSIFLIRRVVAVGHSGGRARKA